MKPIMPFKDEAKFNGDYRTKRTILVIYDALAEAMQTGQAYILSLHGMLVMTPVTTPL